MTQRTAKPAAPGLHLRVCELADKRRVWMLGGRRVKQNDQVLLQLRKRETYVARSGLGRNVCTDVEWVPVRALLVDVGMLDLPPRAAVHADQVVVLQLPVRDATQAARIVATTTMHLAWPGPGVRR